MNILFTGRGGAGSWTIRGEQLARAMGSNAVPLGNSTPLSPLSQRAISDADIVIAVKKVPPLLLQQLRQQRKTWVFDVVDFYPQPACTVWSRNEAIAWVKAQIAALQPTAVVWPNQCMMSDCSDGRPGFVLYHHHRPGLQPISVAPTMRTLAYEGAAAYLGKWSNVLRDVCKARDIVFEVNPRSLCMADAVVAMRDEPYCGYVQSHWKSNVKLANAHAIGATFIGQPECGYKETAAGAELWVRTKDDVHDALLVAASAQFRQTMQAKAVTKTYSVDQAAKDLRGFLHGL
jgi:hypothetical protein